MSWAAEAAAGGGGRVGSHLPARQSAPVWNTLCAESDQSCAVACAFSRSSSNLSVGKTQHVYTRPQQQTSQIPWFKKCWRSLPPVGRALPTAHVLVLPLLDEPAVLALVDAVAWRA
jgi:hypothetical protein